MEKVINTCIFKPFLLEKARKCDDVINYGMGKSTDISIYNTIYNILTLHYILHIYFTSISSYLYLIIYVCISKKPDFLLWLVSPHTEVFLSCFCNNIRNFEEIIAEMRKKSSNADISEKMSTFSSFFEVTSNHFWLRKWRNRLRMLFIIKSSYINEKSRNQKIEVTEPVQLGYALFLSKKCSYFNKKANL